MKNYFLGDAYALLLPVESAEPFEIVTIESLACGTPVVAYNRGSIGEVIKNGQNGFLVEDVTTAIEAIGKLESISRLACRKSFEKSFTSAHMVDKYLEIYKSVTTENDHNMLSMHG